MTFEQYRANKRLKSIFEGISGQKACGDTEQSGERSESRCSRKSGALLDFLYEICLLVIRTVLAVLADEGRQIAR